MAAVRTALGMLAAASLSAATTVVQLPRLPIECHSFNDVDSWAQLMRKGVHWFKLDIGMTVRESCGNYSTWGQPGRGSESDCFVSQNQGQEYCCMGLRGDASTRPFLLSPFNTTWDVLAWFSSPAAQAILPKTGSGQKIMMALDFGGAGIDFFNATESAMLRTLLLQSHDIFTANNLSVSFYNDASMNGWFQSLDQKCFAGQCDAAELALQALPYPSEAGDALPSNASDPYGRFQILNSDETGVTADCNTSSWDASLAKADGNPYLWYEPSSQADYALFFQAWRMCPTVPADKRSPNTGIVIVTNQQPEMFETYSSADINRGLNQLFMDKSNATSPLMTIVDVLPSEDAPRSAAGAAFDRAAILTVVNPATGMQMLHVVGIVDGETPTTTDILQSVSLPSITASGSAAVSIASWAAGLPAPGSGTVPVVVAAANGAVVVFTWNATTGSLSTGTLASLNVTGGSSVLSAVPVCSASACYITAVSQAAGPALDLLAFNVPVAGSGDNQLLFPVASATVQSSFVVDGGASLALLPSTDAASEAGTATFDGVLIYSSSNYQSSNALAAAARKRRAAGVHAALKSLASTYCRDDVGASGLRAADCDIEGMRAAWREMHASIAYADDGVETDGAGVGDGTSAASSSRHEMFGATVTLTVNTTSNAVKSLASQWVGQGTASPQRIALGRSPHVSASLYTAAGTAAPVPSFLLLNTDGVCQSGLLMNNDNTPHCLLATPAGDGNDLFELYQSVTFLLNYNVGSFDAWRRLITGNYSVPTPNGACTNAQYLGSCHPEIMSGKFENGLSPSGALFTRTVQYVNSTEGPNGAPQPELAMLALHDGDVWVPITTTIVCGGPLYKGGIAFDQFRLAQPAVWSPWEAARGQE